jgi:RNA polymerase sigma-70 factor (ECF subfamily)
MLANNFMPSFDEAVLPHLDAAYNLANWLLRNKRDAEDAVQEACLRAFRFFPGFRGGNARAWLMKIVRNTCYTQMRASRPMHDTLEFDENVAPPDHNARNPEQVMLQNDSGDLLRKALQELPVNFREVVILRELEGMSYKEIAEITGMPTGTVMSSLSRARGKLRHVLTHLMKEGASPDSERIAAVSA